MLLWLAILSVYSVRPFGLVGNSKPDKGGWVFDHSFLLSLVKGENFRTYCAISSFCRLG